MSDTVVIGKTVAGEDLSFDVSRLIVSRMLVTASSGSGKSYLLRKILEGVSASTQTIVIDTEGEFATLREARDMVLAGPNGEVPAHPRSAGLLCRRLMELHLSAVIDISELPRHEKRAFVANFVNVMVDLPRSLWRPCIVAVDETHEFASEGEKSESGQALALLVSKGRKRGYALLGATQRLQKLDKDVAAELKNVFIGQMSLDVDLRRAADALGYGKDRWTDIRDLSPPGREGEFFCFGPALNHRGVVKFRSGKVVTTHPKAGQGRLAQPPAASDKILGVLKELKDLPQQAEAEIHDLAAAKKRILDLEREVRSKPMPTEKIVEKPAVSPEQIKSVEKVAATLEREGNRRIKLAGELMEHAKELSASGQRLAEEAKAFAAALVQATAGPMPQRAPMPSRPAIHNQAPPRRIPAPIYTRGTSINGEADDLTLNKIQKRILNALAWYESLGNMEPTAIQVGAVALVDPTGGYFSNSVGPLSTAGLIERGSGTLRLTDAGRAQTHPVENVGTLSEYHDVLRGRVRKMRSASNKTIQMLDAIISASGRSITTAQIGEAVGVDHTGGYFSNSIGPLGTVGLIERKSGTVAPTEVLFPPGLI